MTIIRTKKKVNPYVTIDKTFANDKRLSYKSRGIMVYLLCKPDDWTISVQNLIAMSEKDGRDAVRAGLKELDEAGYLRRSPTQDAKGHFTGWEILLFETPADAEKWDEAKYGKPENPSDGKSTTENRKIRQTGNPKNGKSVDILINDDQSLINENTNCEEPPVPQVPRTPPPTPICAIALTEPEASQEEVSQLNEDVSPRPASQPTHNASLLLAQSQPTSLSATGCPTPPVPPPPLPAYDPIAQQFADRSQKYDWEERPYSRKAKREFVEWYAAKKGWEVAHARSYLQKRGEEERSLDVWRDYLKSQSPDVAEQVEYIDPAKELIKRRLERLKTQKENASA